MAEDTTGKSGKGKGSDDGREVAFQGDPAVQARIDAADGGASEGGTRRSAGETIRDEAGKIGGQATDQLKSFASDGKARATDALDQFAKLLDRAAGDVDAKLGEQYGGYARQASSAVVKFSGQVRDRDVDELFDEVGAFVRKSPGIAIGAAAALGFVVARVLQSSIDAGRDKA
ncbi:hypothetical protein [Sphingomonas sp.]|uniref:hypothetical protein n=1 Tax=Sphingomonas sp. TaxID=28214 RepID=UPI002C94443A|nr:hypothetical protein [Sphingomonas sp.]HWK36314.1 hypothetical protein [Sphingomonas sp.]